MSGPGNNVDVQRDDEPGEPLNNAPPEPEPTQQVEQPTEQRPERVRHEPTPCPPAMRPFVVKGSGRVMCLPFSLAAVAANNRTIHDAAKAHKDEIGEAFVCLAEASGWIRDGALDPRFMAWAGLLATFDTVLTDAFTQPRVPIYGEARKDWEEAQKRMAEASTNGGGG